MQWLGVVAQATAIGLALVVLLIALPGCAVRAGKSADGNELYWSLDTQGSRQPEALSQPEILPPLSQPPPSPLNPGKGSSNTAGRNVTID